jgi:hypothetical protein
MRYGLVVFLLGIVVGCVPYSDNPITNVNQQPMDSSIRGTWFWKDANESGYIHFGIDKESKLLKVVMLEFDKNGELNVSELSGHTSTFVDGKYLNLKWVKPADENPGYLFVKYEVKDAGLEISLMDMDAVEKAIKDGSLSGEIKEGGLLSSVHITDTPEKLQQFVLKNDKELFPEKSQLHRLNLPNVTPPHEPTPHQETSG